MNAAQHTPGPWAYQAFDTEKGVVFDISQVDADISVVDVAYTYSHEANARLIASLPDLLAAAHAALDDVDALRAEGHEDPAWAPALRAAIAKGSAA